MDKEGVKYVQLIDSLKEKFGKRVAPFCYPLGKQDQFDGFAMVVENKARLYKDGVMVDGEIYDLEEENRELEKTIKTFENKKISSNTGELTNQKNKIIEENRQLAERNEELVGTVENLKNVNKKHLESKSWKITKPLRSVNKVFKDKEGYDEE